VIEIYSKLVIKWCWLIIIASIVGVVLIASGAKYLTFDNDYRVFFGDENPELIAFEKLQNTYNKEDNIIIALTPKNGELFTPENLAAVEWLTNEAWQIPFAGRVDSITNYQHTYAEGDDLIVEDLGYESANMTKEQALNVKKIVLAEPQLVNSAVNEAGSVTAINVVTQFPQKSQSENPEAVAFARDLVAKFQAKYPQFEIHLSGMTMLNMAFKEASIKDMSTLIPLMYLFIFIVLFVLMRSIPALLGTVIVIAFSIVTAMGMAGFMGVALTPPSASAPTIIMTLAVADSVHFLITMLALMKRGMTKNDAIIESLRINIAPIVLTSVTTAIGFLAMNSSDAPPFHDLGNITAMGVMFALLFSLFFLPAFMSVMPTKVNKNVDIDHKGFMLKLADFVIAKYKVLFVGSIVVISFLAAMIPQVQLDDNFVEYFDESIQFRTDTDYIIKNLTGINTILYSINAPKDDTGSNSQGISDPIYLSKLNEFKIWLEQQPEVVHVRTLSDIMKRLNKSLHADDESWYKVPDNRELAAQYLLLYEMSLPYGLDLNNQINVDKSATKFTVTLDDLSTKELISFNYKAQNWLVDNTPENMHTVGSSTALMFSNITKRNIEQMMTGSLIALVLISLILMAALKSFRLGVISLLPNLTPVIVATGIWSLTFGILGLAASMVFAISIGIVVDDTVHFLSKYLRAKREKNLSTEEAIRYAFSTVGHALWVTTFVLIIGFGILTMSSFLVNEQTGIMMAITIAAALIIDFLFLPPLLMIMDKVKNNNNATEKT
jgi:predicted RND superfamily exporter protein